MSEEAVILISYFEERDNLLYELMKADVEKREYIGTGRFFRKVDSIDDPAPGDLMHVEGGKFFFMRRVSVGPIVNPDPGPGTPVAMVA